MLLSVLEEIIKLLYPHHQCQDGILKSKLTHHKNYCKTKARAQINLVCV
jgi:hypothetical protein